MYVLSSKRQADFSELGEMDSVSVGLGHSPSFTKTHERKCLERSRFAWQSLDLPQNLGKERSLGGVA